MKITKISLIFCVLFSAFSCNNVENGNKESFDTITIKSLESYEEKISKEDNDFLLRVESEEECKYVNQKEETVIAAGKYIMCFTDTFKTYAVVLSQEEGFIGIDRNENVLFNVFQFDNGPDETSEGLFRYVKDDKIGFINSQSGAKVIEAKYIGAYPFENGKAKVSENCSKEKDGEHYSWKGGDWYYIDHSGKKIDQ